MWASFGWNESQTAAGSLPRASWGFLFGGGYSCTSQNPSSACLSACPASPSALRLSCTGRRDIWVYYGTPQRYPPANCFSMHSLGSLLGEKKHGQSATKQGEEVHLSRSKPLAVAKMHVQSDFGRGLVVCPRHGGSSISEPATFLGLAHTVVSKVYRVWCDEYDTSTHFCGRKHLANQKCQWRMARLIKGNKKAISAESKN